MNTFKTKIIAEIGTAHNGSLEKAFALIDEAKNAGADIIKFQWVYADEILHPDTGFVNLPGGSIRLYDKFRELEEPAEFFKKCLDYTHNRGLLFACSPFGIRSLEELVKIKPDAIKIASPEVNHIPLLERAAEYYGKIPIILSGGVSKLGDLEKAVSILTKFADSAQVNENLCLDPLSILHCITFYPAPEDEYNVRCVETLRSILGLPTGISDHSLDPVLVPVLTAAMGGTLIEKHITLSKKTDGLDDPVALEEDQFALMVHTVHQTNAIQNRWKHEEDAAQKIIHHKMDNGMEVSSAQKEIFSQLMNQYGKEKVFSILGNGIKRLAESESVNYGRTNRSLHYMKNFEKGYIIKEEDIQVLRTEKILTPGISPDFIRTVTGAKLKRNIKSGEGVQLEDFMEK